ncbi:MAG: hypothetical protein GC160_19815 [Acidobacteria bacterium]|nr:hypothetical protein [Acidobacteriota bacterium]
MDFIIVTGDQAMFDPSFPPAVVVPMPGTISGTAQAQVNHVAACVEGDEGSVVVPGAAYTSGAFTIPGVGTLSISSLGGDQVATQAKSGDKAFILKGAKFQAKFEVSAPATNPNSGVPDPTPTYSGTGSFITTNTVSQAT